MNYFIRFDFIGVTMCRYKYVVKAFIAFTTCTSVWEQEGMGHLSNGTNRM